MFDHLLQKHAEPVVGQHNLQQTLLAHAGSPTAQPVREEDLIDFTDYPKIRQRIFDKSLEAVQNLKPTSNEKYTLRISNVKYKDDKPLSKADYKKAVLEGRSLNRKIVGKYELVDNTTGKILESTSQKTIVNVPYMTEFGTFVRNGNDISIQHQMRLRPGVYTRMTVDGYPESQFNLKPGTGPSFRTWMDPATSVFYLSMKGRNVPLYPVMKSMGIDDNHMKSAWGEDIFKENEKQRTSSHAQRWLNEMNESLQAQVKKPVVVKDEVPEVEDFNKNDESLTEKED